MKRVLFICIHNSARSQMAEAFLKSFAGDRFIAESAGLEPGSLNPLVVKAMLEEDIDISQNTTNAVMDFYKQGREYDYVIAVCDKEAADRCPLFPGNAEKLHWPFDDPSSLKGTDEEKMAGVRQIRQDIKQKVMDFIVSVS